MTDPHAVEADRLLTKVTTLAEAVIDARPESVKDVGPKVAIAMGLLALCAIGRAILAEDTP